MKNTGPRPCPQVSADGKGPVADAGAVDDPGKIVLDLALILALGGDCLADTATLRSELFVDSRL